VARQHGGLAICPTCRCYTEFADDGEGTGGDAGGLGFLARFGAVIGKQSPDGGTRTTACFCNERSGGSDVECSLQCWFQFFDHNYSTFQGLPEACARYCSGKLAVASVANPTWVQKPVSAP